MLLLRFTLDYSVLSTQASGIATTMIGQTLQEYVFVRLSILALRLVMPLSFIYFAVSWNTGTFLSSPILGVYTTLETLFFLVVYLPRRSRLQRVRIMHIVPTKAHHLSRS